MNRIFAARFSMCRVLLRALSVLLMAGAPCAVLAEKGEPANLVKWRDGLVSSAQPTAEYLARSRAAGFDMVINLAPPQAEGSIEKEAAIVGRQGVVYLNIPVNFDNPTAEDFRVFADAMKSAAKKNILVHCQVNLRGTAFTFLYRVIHENAPVDESLQKMQSVWSPQPLWKKFIEATLATHGKKIEIL